MRAAAALVAALLASGAVLVGVELGKGALHQPPPRLKNPCHAHGGRTGGVDATIQRIVIDGLNGAACRLHTSREALVLSLGSGNGGRDPHTVEVALRAGLLHAVDEAERRGDVPGLLAPVLRDVVRHAPLDKLVRGGLSLRDLVG